MKIQEYAQMMGWLTRPPRQEPRFMAQGGRLQYKPGGIVEPGVVHYGKKDFTRNPAGINQYTAEMKSLDEIKATIDKFPEWTAKDFLGEGTFNKKGIVLSRTELERAKESGIEPHVKGKRTIKGTGARNLKRRITTKARSSESMEVALAALRKSGLQFSHLALDELTSLQNTGYLPKDINIKSYHKFEKKVVDIAKQIKEAQDNKKFSIPERRNKIAELQKEDRALRKQFPEYAKTKARLVTKATSLDPIGIMIKEKLPDPKIAISQEPGTQLKGVTPKSEKGKEIIEMSKKSLAEQIAQGPDGIKFLNKQAVAQTMWKAIGDKGGKICKDKFQGGGGVVCGLKFATEDPAGYMAKVKKNKDALNAFKLASQSKSKMLKFARAVARDTMNPVGWIGGELLISGGITAAMLSEGYTTRKSIDDGLAWFLPKSVLKSRLHEIEDMAKKEGVDFETIMPFFQLETIAEEHDKHQMSYLKNTDPLYALRPQELEYFSSKWFGKPTSELSQEENVHGATEVQQFIERLKMLPSGGYRGLKADRPEAINASMAGMGSANRKYLDIVKNLQGPFEEGSYDWVLPGVLKQELENIADMSQTEKAKANQLKSLKKTYDRGIDLTVEGKRFIDKDVSFEDWVHKKGKGDLFFNEFQRGPDKREFLTHNLFNPVKQEPYKMPFPGRESIDFSAAPYATGGRVGLKKGKTPYRLSRRGFLQWLAGITGATIAGGTGLIKLGKGATKVAPKVTEEVIKRGADGTPMYIADLIKVVKAKGTKEIVENFHHPKFKYDTVYSYKGVDVAEDAGGNIRIKSDRGGVATDPYTGKTHEGIAQEHHMQIDRGQMQVKDEGLETQKSFQEPDEYIEGTVRPDRDGKMKDFEEGLDEDVHEFFKKIADEPLIKKASGGRVSYFDGGIVSLKKKW